MTVLSEEDIAADLVATLPHEHVRAMLVDWAGDTIDPVAAASGEVPRTVPFVAVLPTRAPCFAGRI
ncbi:hypothetical protein ncot_10250 [Nocardioides sp. JQ2195]|uniref:hypothetical protein n=1 Tax=Nocardioides sp. JQ2195 TaxID=2592334 RepID=UPI00143E5C82|nr:hypothetical protein [Nocardioides sp. JQ2195]QIX26941.1 hypothetical protein ncot_10250 [Nocardioides sp. JQ2195]